MNIFIFGDSYFEPRNGSNDHVVWHDLLDQEYGNQQFLIMQSLELDLIIIHKK